LANLLLDEINSESRRGGSSRREKSERRDDSSMIEQFVNFESMRQRRDDLLEQTPTQQFHEASMHNVEDPPTIRDILDSKLLNISPELNRTAKRKTRFLYATTESDTSGYQMPSPSTKSRKSASKELSQLTDLIRKTSRNQLLTQNTKTSLVREPAS
jgi:hypothetical protein